MGAGGRAEVVERTQRHHVKEKVEQLDLKSENLLIRGPRYHWGQAVKGTRGPSASHKCM